MHGFYIRLAHLWGEKNWMILLCIVETLAWQIYYDWFHIIAWCQRLRLPAELLIFTPQHTSTVWLWLHTVDELSIIQNTELNLTSIDLEETTGYLENGCHLITNWMRQKYVAFSSWHSPSKIIFLQLLHERVAIEGTKFWETKNRVARKKSGLNQLSWIV